VTLRRELSDADVRRIVQESLNLISKTQNQLGIPIAPNLWRTKLRLETGSFVAGCINRRRGNRYSMDYGSFTPPSTITLDRRLPSSDHPLDLPDLAETMTAYSGVHEVIHADDHTGGDRLLLATREHILREHSDKLEKSMAIIRREGGCSAIGGYGDLASLWAVQYVDMVTHYRSFKVLQHQKYPQLDHIWSRLSDDFFPPNLLTCIENSRGTQHVFSLFTERAGEYCLIEALEEYNAIKERDSSSYTV
jgi:hypothetical protein